MIDSKHPTSIPLLDESGSLRPMLGFDYESHLVVPGNSAPRSVCASFWGRGFASDDVDSFASTWSVFHGDRALFVRERGDFGLVCTPDVSIEVLFQALEDTRVLLLGNYVMYDVTQSIAHAERLERLGRLSVGSAVRFRTLWLDAFAARRVIDVKERDKLIAVSFGLLTSGQSDESGGSMHVEGMRIGAPKYSLRDIVYRRFLHRDPVTRDLERVDLQADKKPGPCETCGATGKVAVGIGETADCLDCKGTGTYVPWRLRYHDLEGVPLSRWPDKAVDYSLMDALWPIDIALDQGELFPYYGTPGLYDIEGTQGSSAPLLSVPATALQVFDHNVGYRAVSTPRGGVVDEAWQAKKWIGLDWKALWGLRTNRERGERWAAEMDGGANKQAVWGYKHGFVRLDGSVDTKALRARVEAAYYARGLDAPQTDKGNTQTDNDTLRESRDPILVTFAEFGSVKKNRNTFVPIVQRGYTHPITYRFDPLKRTGRTSASDGLHQPPRGGGFRGCFEPRPGRIYCSVDWSGAETITLAQVMLWMFGPNEFTSQVLEGVDTHTKLAVAMYNADHPSSSVTYAEALKALANDNHPLHRIFAGDPDAPERTSERIGLRQFGKVPNFGFRGGLGPGVEGDPKRGLVAYARAMAGIHLPLNKARELKELWLAEYPVMQEYFNRVSSWCADSTFTYENWVSGRKRGESRYTDGCNAGFQPLVGDALGLWEWLVALACFHPGGYTLVGAEDGDIVWGGFRSPGRPGIDLPAFVRTGKRSPLYGSRGVLSVHDEQILELPWNADDPAPTTAAAMELSRLGVDALAAFCPDMVSVIEAEPALCLRWHKSMKAVWDGDALIPWEPRGGW